MEQPDQLLRRLVVMVRNKVAYHAGAGKRRAGTPGGLSRAGERGAGPLSLEEDRHA
ncbi:MAG TPA: hypothetical protein VKU02_32340 [Gemmataceae bacterium]|nr:hypothetical protein [Gemmataceae bacterium]